MSSILLIVLDANTRAEIHRLASTDSTMAVSDAVGTLAAARDALERRLPDLIVADLRLPDGPVVNLFDELRPRRAHVLVLTPSLCDPHLMHTLRHGADGYVLAHARGAELLERMRRTLAGESPMDATVAQKLAVQFGAALPLLSNTEQRLLHSIGAGQAMAEVARGARMTPQQLGLALRSIYRTLHRDMQSHPKPPGAA